MVTSIPRELLRSIITNATEVPKETPLRPDFKDRLIGTADTIQSVAFGVYNGPGCGCPAVIAGILTTGGEPATTMSDDEFDALCAFMTSFDKQAAAHAYPPDEVRTRPWAEYGFLEVTD